MNNFDYKNMTPFKWFVLENFPFIESDFEAINNYQLFSKVVEYLNKTIDNVNELGQLVEEFSNYFDNLDVQEEINNKLDEMVEAGTLQEIITQYLQVNGVLCYNTLNDLKNATNLINGSFARTFGNLTYNDGNGSLYKIRTITNDDIVDNINIIPVNFSNTLIAEKQKNNNLSLLNSNATIMIGDSYGEGLTMNEDGSYNNIIGWCDILKNLLNLNNDEYYKFVQGGAGFYAKSSATNQNFLDLLQDNINTIENKDLIKNIIVCGGYNDNGFLKQPLENSINEFITYCNSQFPNAKIFIGLIGSNYGAITSQAFTVRSNLYNNVFLAYNNCNKYGAIYLNGVENVMKNCINFSKDNVHPNQNGYNILGSAIYQAFKSGYYNYTTELIRGNIENTNNYDVSNDIFSSNNIVFQIMGKDNRLSIGNMEFNFNSYPQVNTQATFSLGVINNNCFRCSDTSISIPVQVEITSSSDGIYKFLCLLRINQLNALYLDFYGSTSPSQPSTTTITTKKLKINRIFNIIPTCYC